MEKFIPIFNQIHNYKYDYSESEYRGYDENIKINIIMINLFILIIKQKA